MLADLIRSAALLRYFQRDRRTLDDQTIRLYATPEDFKTAGDIFTALNGTAGSQDAKLTKRESQILDIIDRADLSEFTFQTIVGLTQIPYQPIRRTFVGYFSHGAKYSGLLEKCPALSTHDQTTSAAGQDGGSSIGRKETAFTFNREIYSSWSKGGLVWLRPDDDDGGDGADPDPRFFHHFQHVFSTFSSIDEKKAAGDLPADYGKEEGSSIKNNKDPFFSSNQEKRGNTIDQGASSLPPSRYSAFDENKDGKNFYGAKSTKREHTDGGSCSSTAEKKGNVAEVDEKNSDTRPTSTSTPAQDTVPQPAAEPALTLAQVNPGDYSPIADGSLIEPCPVCGGRVVHYTERYQARQARGPKGTSRHICRSCYNKARDREQAAVQILPGAIPLDEVKPITAGLLGRCSVCGLQAATYDHAGSGTAICSRCYEKLVREQVDVR
jgi:hypothetical protein